MREIKRLDKYVYYMAMRQRYRKRMIDYLDEAER